MHGHLNVKHFFPNLLNNHIQLLLFQVYIYQTNISKNYYNSNQQMQTICLKITIILQHTSSYEFRSSLVHHQEAHNCTKKNRLTFSIPACSGNAENSVLRNRVLPDDGTIGPETCRSWCFIILL